MGTTSILLMDHQCVTVYMSSDTPAFISGMTRMRRYLQVYAIHEMVLSSLMMLRYNDEYHSIFPFVTMHTIILKECRRHNDDMIHTGDKLIRMLPSPWKPTNFTSIFICNVHPFKHNLFSYCILSKYDIP
jgi:hypothetical protein